MTTQPVTFSRFEAELLDLYRAARSRATFIKMRQVLREVAALDPPPATTAELTPALVVRWIAAHPGRTGVTTYSHLSALRAACGFARRMGWLAVSPFEVVRDWGVDGTPADAPRHLSREQVARLLAHTAAASASGCWRAGRLHALASLLCYTGLRRGEAIHLSREDIDLAAGFVFVPRRRLAWRSKTATAAAPVPIPDALAPVLAGWLPRAGCEWVFPGVSRRGPWTGGPRSDRALEALRAAGEAAGVGRVNFLVLRHTWATHAASWGLGPIEVKLMLRHTTIRTQARYIHPDRANLRAAVKGIRFDGSDAA